MATRFSIPKSPSRSILTIDTFLGADFTNSPSAVDITRSPNCQNMIRDVPGKVRKCMGYQTIETYNGPINGYHVLRGVENGLVHVGTEMYHNGKVLYSNAKDSRSKSWQFEDKLYIVDGKAILVWDGETIKKASEYAKIPIVTIAKTPNGGGTAFESFNLLQPGFTELFLGTENGTAYQLTFGELDEDEVKVSILDENGIWQDKVENTDFTVDRISGIVNFVEAPGLSPVTGEDNVKITAYRTIEGYADRVNKCDIGTQYGTSGTTDRLFLSGNPDLINYDWFSEANEPTYFPDLNYGVLGSARSAVMGYSVINGYLATHKDEMELDNSLFLREGVIVNDMPAFRTVNTLQGAGAVAKDSFNYLSNEPLFLTRLGVYAITAQDITGEKYGQNRSFFLNGKLLNEVQLEKAFSFVYKDMYWLFINDVAYILDGLQPLQTDKSMPYATRQYAGFYRTNLPANCAWEKDGDFYFGTLDGRICKFFSNTESPDSYNDDGEAIKCVWETPDIDGKFFYKNKTFRYLAVRLRRAFRTSVEILNLKRGVWSLVKNEESKTQYFMFSRLKFSEVNFSSDDTEKIVSTKMRIKKVDKARFRFENNVANESFGIFNIAMEFVENGNYKG